MKKILFGFVSMILILSACSTPATPVSLPTNTPLPPPTQTLVPPTLTATLEPSPTATPDPLIFRDDFEGVLDGSWQWIREKNKYWSLTNNPGWLEIMAKGGHVGNNDISNLLLHQSPDGNFELETKLNFKPTGNFQIGGLLIYEDAKNFIQFGRAFCGPCIGDGFYVDLTTNGVLNPGNFATAAPATDTVYLRLSREGKIFTAYSSEDGVQWKRIGTHNSDMKPLFVGLVAGQAVGSAPKPAQFDYFVINKLP